MAYSSSSTYSRLTYPLHLVSSPPTSLANLRFPAVDFPLRFPSNLFSSELSSPQSKSVPVPAVFSDRRSRRSMEPVNVYVASNSTEIEIGSQEIVKNPSLICALVMADSIDKMVAETCKAQELGADLVEIRLDSLKEFNPLEDLKTIIKKSPLPTLFTYRWSPYGTTTTKYMICKQQVHQDGKYCHSCAYSKGVCAMCGVGW